MPYPISPYQPRDQEYLVEFLRAVLEELGFDFDVDTKDADLRNIPAVYHSNGGIFLLARHDAHIVGTVALRQISQSTCELKRFYVHKDHRGHGVGIALLNAIIAQ